MDGRMDRILRVPVEIPKLQLPDLSLPSLTVEGLGSRAAFLQGPNLRTHIASTRKCKHCTVRYFRPTNWGPKNGSKAKRLIEYAWSFVLVIRAP